MASSIFSVSCSIRGPMFSGPNVRNEQPPRSDATRESQASEARLPTVCSIASCWAA